MDFWRGLCLIDMVLVHLYYQKIQFGDFLGPWVGNYTRFAAGGFIFISGLSISVIFLPRASKPERRVGTYVKLWRRSLYILLVQYFSAMGLQILTLLWGNDLQATGVAQIFKEIFLLQRGGDLLPFYIMMIAMSPIFLEFVRRRHGWIVLIAASLGLFAWGLNHPWFGAVAMHDVFPPILWQAVFVSGLVFGSFWKAYNLLTWKPKAIVAAVSWIVFGLLFVSEYSSDFGWPHLNLFMSFTKVPLSVGEALRYMSATFGLILTTDIAWPLLKNLWPTAFVETLGRKSLPVYVLHLWVVDGASALAMSWWWIGRWQITFALAAILLLWAFALSIELFNSIKLRRQAQPQFYLPEMAQG